MTPITQGRKDLVRILFEKNDWSNVFPEFAEKITNIIGKKNSALVLENFSTTGRSDFMSYQVVLMDLERFQATYPSSFLLSL